jgi:hypothetical protein
MFDKQLVRSRIAIASSDFADDGTHVCPLAALTQRSDLIVHSAAGAQNRST